MNDAPTRCGFVALIGEPNVGKSTLLNRAVGARIAPVTHKVQTTRARLRGIAVSAATQIVFVDTPGLFRPRRRLDRAMVAAAWSAADDADVTLLMVEAQRGLTDGLARILENLAAHTTGRKVALVVNKIDRVRRDALLALVAEMTGQWSFEETFLISAETGDGVDALVDWLAGCLPEGPWHYSEDQIADAPMRAIAAEITREKLTLRLHQELPYQLTVETENWQDMKDGSARIEQVVFVAREGHRGIVLGKRGETIKAVGVASRRDLSTLLERPVHLFLDVRVKPNWQEDRERYERIGLEFRDGDP